MKRRFKQVFLPLVRFLLWTLLHFIDFIDKFTAWRAGRDITCVVIGAGATAYCDIANEARRPPLVQREDFLRIFSEPIDYSLASSVMGEEHLNPFFSWAFQYFDDIEELFTVLYLISREDNYAGIHEVLKSKYKEELWLDRALVTASKLTFTALPRNIITLLLGMVREEIVCCLGTRGRRPQKPPHIPLSAQHSRLARLLLPGDRVVSFNYDTVMDYALLNEHRINTSSFKNPYIKPLGIPKDFHAKGTPIYLYKPHGSFNWFSRLETPADVGVFFGETFQSTDYMTPSPLILPYHIKDQIMKDFPPFHVELQLSFAAMKISDELILIGKQFMTGDTALRASIKKACSTKKRRVIYVNPSARDLEWRASHDSIFNANNVDDSDRCFDDLNAFLSKRESA